MTKLLFIPVVKKFIKQIIAMVMVCAVAIGAFTGLVSGYINLDRSIGDYVENYNCADCIVSCDYVDETLAAQLGKIKGVKTVNSRLTTDISAVLDEGRSVTFRVFTYKSNDFGRFHYWDKTEKEGLCNVLLDRNFAENNNVKAGDILWLRFFNSYDAVFVGGLVSCPETVGEQRNEYIYGRDTDFGCIYLPCEALSGSAYAGLANQFMLLFDENADGEAVAAQAEEVLSGKSKNVKAVLYKNSKTYEIFSSNIKSVQVLSELIPAVFYCIMLMVLVMFIIRILDQSTVQIGILRANGISCAKIRRLFSLINLMITIAGSVIGFVFGYLIMSLVDGRYGDFFSVPEMRHGLSPVFCMVSAAVTVIVGQLAIWLCYGKIRKIEPSLAMKPLRAESAPDAAAKLVPRGLSPLQRFGFISMMRNPKRLVFSVLSIAASFILIFGSLSLFFSKKEIVRQMYSERCHYDCQFIAGDKTSDEVLRELESAGAITEAEKLLYCVEEIRYGNSEKTALILGTEAESNMLSVCNEKGKPVKMPESGIVLDSKLAKELGISAGDRITVGGQDFEVSMISHQYTGGVNYLNYRDAQKLCSAADALFCNYSDEAGFIEAINDIDPAGLEVFSSVQKETLSSMLKLTSAAVWIVLFVALVLGLAIMYDTSMLNLSDRRKELASLLAQGFELKEISELWLQQYCICFVAALIPGVPLGIFFAKTVLRMMSAAVCSFPFPGRPIIYFISLLCVAAYLYLSHMAAMGAVRDWNVTEIIKE